MENVFWTGFSESDWLSVIDKIRRVVSVYGSIVDVRLFSDISLNMTIEIEELKIDKLYEDLTHVITLQKPAYLNSISKRERTIYLNITFTKGTGNLRIEVPSVPG